MWYFGTHIKMKQITFLCLKEIEATLQAMRSLATNMAFLLHNNETILSSVCQQNNDTAYGDIRINDVSEDVIGDALEDVGSKGCSDDDPTKSETVVCQDGHGKEAVVGTDKGHHHIANQKVSLRHSHIVFLGGFRLDEIEHGWRALHAEEASHQSAECTSTYLETLRCRQLDLLAE